MINFNIKTKDSMEHSGKAARYLNQYCTEKCVNNIVEGKLQCECGDSGVYNWTWEKPEDSCAILSKNNCEITFHPVYSSGTAALRGSTSLRKNIHHFWEMKMLSNLYGTDVMVGVGTGQIILTNWRYRFFSLLGFDKQSWGYSYNGLIQHDSIMKCYGSKFGLGSLIGVHLNMCTGTLEFYLNRRPLGVAFKGLKAHELYPMICSTAAQSAMKMTFSASVESSLQLACLQCIVKHPQIYRQFHEIPGLVRIYENKFFWMFPREPEDSKRKLKQNMWSIKRRKMILPIKWSDCRPESATFKVSLHFTNCVSNSASNSDMDDSVPSTSN